MNRTTLDAQRTSDERGFSLIEVMVAIVILTVGLLSLAQMMVLSTSSNTLSGQMTSCSALAKEQLERLKAIPFYTDPQARTPNPLLAAPSGDLNAAGGGGNSQFYDDSGLPSAAGQARFEVRWQITQVNNPGLPLEMLRIQVRCVHAAGDRDFVSEALFTTFRTANVG